MAKAKIIREKDRIAKEEQELQEFIAQRDEKRKTMIKSALAIVVCIGLVIAFCLPSLGMLL